MPASANDADVILLFGGDGTIHRHLGPLVRLGLPVLVVPAGSGNDFARAIGLPHVRDSVAAWWKFCAGAGNVGTIDLGVISQIASESISSGASAQIGAGASLSGLGARDSQHAARYFCCVAGIGLDAEVARRANSFPRWLRGNGGYVFSLLSMIFRFTPMRMKIRKYAEDANHNVAHANDASWTTISDQPTILAAFANTPTYGGGMKIAPKAKMDDGLLDVCIVGAVDPFKLFCLFPTVYYGQHLRISGVRYFHAARVRVETEHPGDVFADGEFVCRTPVEIGIERGALKVIVPSSVTP